MRDKILGLTILGVLSYIIYKHFKKPVVTQPPIYVPVQIGPEVHESVTVNTKSHVAPLAHGYLPPALNPVYARTTYKAPYDTFGFGMDTARNMDSIDPDSYLHMPLESEGITHLNKDLYKDIDEEPVKPLTVFKYIRIKFKRTRSGQPVVSIGGIRFLMSIDPIQISTHIWNPHTGEKSIYSGGSLKDDDQMTFIFIFSEPAQLNRYELKTSMDSDEMDPVSWILEGSQNGSYWSMLDTRSNVAMPIDRNMVVSYFIDLER